MGYQERLSKLKAEAAKVNTSSTAHPELKQQQPPRTLPIKTTAEQEAAMGNQNRKAHKSVFGTSGSGNAIERANQKAAEESARQTTDITDSQYFRENWHRKPNGAYAPGKPRNQAETIKPPRKR